MCVYINTRIKRSDLEADTTKDVVGTRIPNHFGAQATRMA
jgi:hypothetical protein